MRRDQKREPAGEDLERLLAERGNRLMGIAIVLTGERADAEDLLQAALERLLRNRRSVTVDTEAYLRHTLYNLAADRWRRRGVWRRKISLLRAERAGAGAEAAADDTATVDLRDALAAAAAPPHQRAVIMLRYWEQLSEADAAEMLGCSKGAVKSAASKGLQRLRELARCWPEAETPPARDGEAGMRQRPGQLMGMAEERS